MKVVRRFLLAFVIFIVDADLAHFIERHMHITGIDDLNKPFLENQRDRFVTCVPRENEMRKLAFEFVPVLDAMVEYRLRLVVRHRQIYADGNHAITVTFDPSLDRETMVRPAPEGLQRLWRAHNIAQPPPVLCLSNRSVELLNVWLSVEKSAAGLSIIVTDGARLPSFDGRLVELVDSSLLGEGNSLLRAILMSALFLPCWDTEVQNRALSEHSVLGLYLESDTARLLMPRGEGWAGEGMNGPVLLAQRSYGERRL